MICCIKRSDSPTTQLSISQMSNQKKPKRTCIKKLAPDLEAKVIGPPDLRHKSIKHPSTHDPPKQTPKHVQTQPTKIPMSNSKTKKRWNNNANRSSSNKTQTNTSYKLNHHKHRPDHLFSATL